VGLEPRKVSLVGPVQKREIRELKRGKKAQQIGAHMQLRRMIKGPVIIPLTT
jgi:hypothetical protein